MPLRRIARFLIEAKQRGAKHGAAWQKKAAVAKWASGGCWDARKRMATLTR